MKKIIILGTIFLCQTLIFCHSKEKKVEKEQVIEYRTYFNNHKYDDDEITLRKNNENKINNSKEDENQKANAKK